MQIANQFRTDILAGKYAQGEYGLMKLFYKFPLSKAAFGAAIKREMNA